MGRNTNHQTRHRNQPMFRVAPPVEGHLNTLTPSTRRSTLIPDVSDGRRYGQCQSVLCFVKLMHTQDDYKMYHQQDQSKHSPVMLDVLPQHYNLHHGQPSPPESPNTTQYTKGERLLDNVLWVCVIFEKSRIFIYASSK